LSRDYGPIPLSGREREVAALVADGLTDREIAQRLHLSPRTVEGHLQSIRNKLGMDNRAQIASYITRQAMGAETADDERRQRPPNNLPVQLTSFIGRGRELTDTKRLLQQARLLTITGPGGSGKTRLAVEAARDLFHRYPAGTWFVDLTALSDQDGVPRALAEVLGIKEVDGVNLLDTIATVLGSARRRGLSLVILDNCEHVINGSAATVDGLLKAHGGLVFLCTGREPLHVSGELVHRLGPMSLPDVDSHASAASVMTSEAVELFVERACLSDQRFALDDANAAEVAHLCRRLDGIPLALELAAARVGLMPFPQLVRHLDAHIRELDRFGTPSRQQTLSATFRWSYDLLTDPERRLLRTLSVFSGGFTYETTEGVCRSAWEPGSPSVVGLLPLLVDKSLVVPMSPRQDRYRCLEIVRQHAGDLLRESGELEDAYRSYVEYFLSFVEEAGGKLSGPTQTFWLDRLTADHDNIRTALALSHSESLVRRLGLIVALNRFWQVRGHLSEGREFVDDVLQSIEGQERTPLTASALNVAAGLAWNQGDVVQARAWLEASTATWQSLGIREGVQFCLQNLALIACNQEDWDTARAAFAQSLAIARELRDDAATGLVLCNLGLMVAHLDEHEDALKHLQEAHDIMQRLEDHNRVAMVLANQGMAALFRRDDGEAARRYHQCLETIKQVGARQYLAEVLEGVACLEARCGRVELALQLAGAADSLRDTVGNAHTPFTRRLQNEWLPQARASLGEGAEGPWDAGAALPEDAAMTLAGAGHVD
jgi:predicted ATPase/DNA-binding CsgD family transcriptional regulator